MRILKLTTDKIEPITARVYKNKDNNELYYNIKHGTYGPDSWAYSCCLYKPIFTPVNENDKYILDNNNYELKAIIKDDKILKDKHGNVVYNITTNKHNSDNRHNIIFWELPNKEYKDITYEVIGIFSILGSGITNHGTIDNLLLAPALVIEAVGPVKLTWKAKDINDNNLSQTVSYIAKHNKWIVGDIIKE